MIIVNITGQFGNQMFQYAVGRHLQLQGRDVRYYLGYYEGHPEHDFALERVFGLRLPQARRERVLAFREDRHRLVDRVRRKLFGSRPHVFSEIGKDSYAYDAALYDIRKGLVDGYWQSGRYFDDIQEDIRERFSFPCPSERNVRLAGEMRSRVSISIHVRRGDYLGGLPVMDEKYYMPAMAFFRKTYGNVTFYVFSNDMDWCRGHIKADDVRYVDWNTGANSPWDMWLMSKCQHNIIANSSFSWWGAWLNLYPDKRVIAPSRWFDHAATPDIYEKDWIIMPV